MCDCPAQKLLSALGSMASEAKWCEGMFPPHVSSMHGTGMDDLRTKCLSNVRNINIRAISSSLIIAESIRSTQDESYSSCISGTLGHPLLAIFHEGIMDGFHLWTLPREWQCELSAMLEPGVSQDFATRGPAPVSAPPMMDPGILTGSATVMATATSVASDAITRSDADLKFCPVTDVCPISDVCAVTKFCPLVASSSATSSNSATASGFVTVFQSPITSTLGTDSIKPHPPSSRFRDLSALKNSPGLIVLLLVIVSSLYLYFKQRKANPDPEQQVQGNQ